MRAQTRRTDALPLTWEVPAIFAMATLLGAVLALPAGQGLAFKVTGEPFAWPTGQLADSLLTLAAGDPGVGLPTAPAGLPPTPVIYSCIVVLEVTWALLIGWATSVWWRTHGPGAQIGLASRHEVRAIMGTTALRSRRKTIRPDLPHSPRLTQRGAR